MVTERKETKQMQSTFEKLGGTYRQKGDYLLPNVKAPESPAIGVWGQRRHKYLVEHNHALYTALLLSGKLTTHLEEIDRVASKMYDRLVEQLSSYRCGENRYRKCRIRSPVWCPPVASVCAAYSGNDAQQKAFGR